MNCLRLLAISPPCIEPVNRAVYRVLARDLGVDVHLIVPSRIMVGSHWKAAARVEGEPFRVTLLEPRGAHPRLQQLAGLDTLIRSARPTHLLVDNDPGTRMTVGAARAAWALGPARPQVWALTAENLMPAYAREIGVGLRAFQPNRVAGPIISWWLRRSARSLLDRVFTISREGTTVMEQLGYVGRAVQIPLGFDPQLFHRQPPEQVAATRARLGLREKTIAYFGRLTPEKGLHVLLRSLAALKDLRWQFLVDRFADYETPYAAELRAYIADAGMSERMVFFDAQHAEMPNFMNAADFVVLPSVSTPKWKEQYGRVLPEAMACGKVVIGAATGAIPELIGNGGHTFPEGNPDELARLLRGLLMKTETQLSAVRHRAEARAHEELSAVQQAAIWRREMGPSDARRDEMRMGAPS